MHRYDKVFVAGEWQRGQGTTAHALVNPATEEVYAEVVESTEADVDRAVSAASLALTSGAWAESSLADRIRAVRGIQRWLSDNRERLATETAGSLGLPITMARDLGASIEVIDMCIRSIESLRLEFIRSEPSGSTLIIRRPVGVVAGVTPWNTPLRAEVKKAIPALLAGCTVVLKPAPDTPFGAMALADAAASTGLPPGVLNVVFGGPTTGTALVSHPAVNKIAFTGSTATGATIARAASDTFKRLQLELGGKSAAIVLADADIETTTELLSRGNFLLTGQMCTAITRILVPRSRSAEVTAALVDRAQSYRIGDPLDEKTTMGPLVNKSQYERVLRYIDIGKAEGGRLLTGGTRPPDFPAGWYVEPTVFTGVTNSMTIAREEIFGPVASIIEYADEDDAVAIANDTPYGLNAAVISTDEEHALRVGRRIQSGVVGVNKYGGALNMPFGGVKRSGTGREHGPEGIEGFLEYQSFGVSESLADELAARGTERDFLDA